MLTVVIVLAALVLACAVYGWFEAGWLRKRVLEVPIDGLPEALDGLRIGHLSDFHLGAPLSRGNGASARAVDWVAQRRPELVCVTGDLVSHPRGEARLRELLARLDDPFVILGNHDVAVTRDPFSRAAELRDLEQARLLRDEEATVERHGERVSVVGVDPEAYRAGRSRPTALVDGRRRSSTSPVPLPVGRRPDPAGRVPSRALGPPSRRPDLPAALAHAEADARPSARAVRRRALRDAVRGDARVAGNRDDLRPVPLLRATGGHGARSASSALDWPGWKAAP